MDKIKGFMAEAKETLTALSSSPQDAEGDRSKVAAGFYNLKRRVEEKVLESVHQVLPTPDEEYDARKGRIMALERILLGYVKYFSLFLDGVRSSAHSTNELAGLTAELYAGCDARQQATVGSYCSGLRTFDSGLRARFDASVVKEVIEPLQRLLEGIEQLKKGMRERELCKLDSDAHYRRAKALKEQGSGGDPHALLQREERLLKTQATLGALTQALFRSFDDIEARRHSMLAPSLRRFTMLQQAFYQEGAAAAGRLPDIPEMAAGVPIFTPAAPLLAQPLQGRAAMPADVASSTGAGSQAMQGLSLATVAPVSAAAAAGRPMPAVPAAAAAAAATQGQARALHGYVPACSDELALVPGQLVDILERHADGWWLGRDRASGARGVFPSNHVEEA